MAANYPNLYDVEYSQRGGTDLNSSLIYQDASYLRLRNIRLSYDFGKELIERLKVAALSLYISSDNVFVLKSKELYAVDPEGATIGSDANSYEGSGIFSAMPRRFVFGLNVGF